MSLNISPTEVAAKWASLLEERDLTEAERAALHRWLLADPSHADALGEACYICSAVSALSVQQRAEILALPAGVEEAADHETGEEATEVEVPSSSSASATRPQWRVYSLAASVFFATVLGILLFTADSAGWLPKTYRTGTAEIQIVELPDGSIVHLNAKTTVHWSGFTRERRSELIAGQALFEIAHDPARPFTVRVNGGLVRVLGTRFDLNRLSDTDTTILTVLDGVVDVQNDGEPASGRWHRIVRADQRLTYDRAGPIDDVRPVDATRTIRWRNHALEFEKEPLAAVVEQLSRYTDQRIVLSDDQLKPLEVVGMLQVGDIRAALRNLQEISPVVVRENGTAFVLEPRPSTEPPKR